MTDTPAKPIPRRAIRSVVALRAALEEGGGLQIALAFVWRQTEQGESFWRSRFDAHGIDGEARAIIPATLAMLDKKA